MVIALLDRSVERVHVDVQDATEHDGSLQGRALAELQFTITGRGRQSAISLQRSAISFQQSAVSFQQSAFSGRLSAISS
jgi:hypothetical protein